MDLNYFIGLMESMCRIAELDSTCKVKIHVLIVVVVLGIVQ
jgi:hypothetical protein